MEQLLFKRPSQANPALHLLPESIMLPLKPRQPLPCALAMDGRGQGSGLQVKLLGVSFVALHVRLVSEGV